jgi:hypothetical protein
MNSSLKDFIANFPTTMCSPPSIPKAIMDLTRYGDGIFFWQVAYLANSLINPIHMVESMMGDTCVYIPIYGMGLVYTLRCTS